MPYVSFIKRCMFTSTLMTLALSTAAAADTVAIEGRLYGNGESREHRPMMIVDSAGQVFKTTTDSHGRYHAIGLVPGAVRISVGVGDHDFTAATPCTAPLLGTLREDIELRFNIDYDRYANAWTTEPLPVDCRAEPQTQDVYFIR